MTTQEAFTLAAVDDKVIPFSFAEVASGLLYRYPNPLSKHVLCSDIIEPFRITSEGELTGKSITLKTNPLPKLFERWSSSVGFHRNGIKLIAIVEEYLIDIHQRTVAHLSRNITSREYLKTHELVRYVDPSATRSPAHHAQQLLQTNTDHVASGQQYSMLVQKQMACSTSASSLQLVQRPIRNITVKRWKKNSWKQSHGLCYSIAKSNYCELLANEFANAGTATKWSQTVERLREIREHARAQAMTTKAQALATANEAIKNPKNIRHLHDAVKKLPKV